MIASSPIRLRIKVGSEHVFCYQSVAHSSQLALVPLNLTEFGKSGRDFRASEEHLVMLGQVFALVSNRSYEVIDNHRFDLTKIRLPAVLGNRILASTFEGEFSSCKFLPTTKLIPFIGCTESKTHTIQTKHV
jgi:hypothetical protein